MREDVEEGEEGEDVGGVHPESESDRAGEPGGDAAEQPCRQQQYDKDKKKIENQNYKNTGRRYPCRIGSHQSVHARSKGGNLSLEKSDFSRNREQGKIIVCRKHLPST